MGLVPIVQRRQHDGSWYEIDARWDEEERPSLIDSVGVGFSNELDFE